MPVLACVGGGSNAMGAFYEFIPDESVRLIGCEAADEESIPRKQQRQLQPEQWVFSTA